MGKKVAVVTDTIGCIPEEELNRYNVREVPVRILFGNRVFQDRVDLSAGEFYTLLKKAKELPTTAAPSPGHFLEAYREIGRKANDILCITLSSKLSGIFNSAKLAADMAREVLPDTTVEVLDSRTAAAAEGFVVLAAARAAALGKSMAEVVNIARDTMGRVHLLAIVDSLHYLARGGRVPKVIAWAGSLLNIKPILTIKGGEAVLAARARTYQGALKRMLEMMGGRITKGLPLHIAVIHAAEPEKAGELKDQIAASFECSQLLVTEFTPVMGAHTGPGLIGVCFYNEVP